MDSSQEKKPTVKYLVKLRRSFTESELEKAMNEVLGSYGYVHKIVMEVFQTVSKNKRAGKNAFNKTQKRKLDPRSLSEKMGAMELK